MLRPVRTAAPTDPVVTTQQVKAHAIVDFDDDNDLLDSLTQAAIDHLDGWSGVLGRCLVSQTWRLDLDDWPACGSIRLPFPDVTSATLKYSDEADAEQPVNAALYEILDDSKSGIIKFRDAFTYPGIYSDRSDGVRVTFVAGFGNADAVPSAIKVAIKMLVTHWYENRGLVGKGGFSELPIGVRSLIAPYRRNII